MKGGHLKAEVEKVILELKSLAKTDFTEMKKLGRAHEPNQAVLDLIIVAAKVVLRALYVKDP